MPLFKKGTIVILITTSIYDRLIIRNIDHHTICIPLSVILSLSFSLFCWWFDVEWVLIMCWLHLGNGECVINTVFNLLIWSIVSSLHFHEFKFLGLSDCRWLLLLTKYLVIILNVRPVIVFILICIFCWNLYFLTFFSWPIL